MFVLGTKKPLHPLISQSASLLGVANGTERLRSYFDYPLAYSYNATPGSGSSNNFARLHVSSQCPRKGVLVRAPGCPSLMLIYKVTGLIQMLKVAQIPGEAGKGQTSDLKGTPTITSIVGAL